MVSYLELPAGTFSGTVEHELALICCCCSLRDGLYLYFCLFRKVHRHARPIHTYWRHEMLMEPGQMVDGH